MKILLQILSIIGFLFICSCSKSENSKPLDNPLAGHTYECFFMKSVSSGKDVYHYMEFHEAGTARLYYKEGGLTRDEKNSSYTFNGSSVTVDGQTGQMGVDRITFENTTAVPGTTIELVYKKIK